MGTERIADRLTRLFDCGAKARGLRPRARHQLVAEQLNMLSRMVPVLAVVTAFLACVPLTAIYGHDNDPTALWWSISQFVILAFGLSGRGSTKGISTSRNPVSRYAAFAFILGFSWALAPLLLMPHGHGSADVVTVLAVIGAMSTASAVFATFPPILVAFLVPAVPGVVIAVFALDDVRLSTLFTAATLGFAGLVFYAARRQSSLLIDHMLTESTIRDQRNIISLLLREFEENSSDWLWETDALGSAVRVSDRFAHAAGGYERIESRSLVGFLRERAREDVPIVDEIARSIDVRATFSNLVVRLVFGNDEKWWRLTGKPAFDEEGACTGYVGTASDVTAEKLAERRINFLAHNDTLTGLLNRARFVDQLQSAVARLERYGSPFAVLILDLDQFKVVNDSRGHLVGDKLLVAVAKRFKGCIRETDQVARLGGNEFATILTANCGRDEIVAIAERFVREISAPYDIDGEQLNIGVSIGIALAPMDGARPDQIMRNAELALFRAKSSGRGVYRFFETRMDSELRERRVLEMQLRNAIDAGELVLHYQPLISAESRDPAGFEALIRWEHPQRGLVSPVDFIPLAEQSGIIAEIGDWTLRKACADAAAWPAPYIVAVNLSARHFQSSDIVSVVRDALWRSGLRPERLELEITESLLIDNPDNVVAKLAELKQLGVTVALDDFGTGYSSLSYLLKFPFDKIKIDKSFVNALSEDPAARDILRSIASLGRTLRMKVTAEGVETPEQVEFLREISLSHLQGYFFARPLDGPGMASYLLRGQATAMKEVDAGQSSNGKSRIRNVG